MARFRNRFDYYAASLRLFHCLFGVVVTFILLLGLYTRGVNNGYHELELAVAVHHPPTSDGISGSTSDSANILHKLILLPNSSNLMVDFNERIVALEQKYKLEAVKCDGLFASNQHDYTTIMHDTGMMISWVCGDPGEQKVSKVMMHVFEKYANSSSESGSSSNSNSKGLMLDVGANSGYYSLLAANFGHMAVQFDLQPECQKVLRNSVLANQFQDQVVTLAAGVSDLVGSIDVPNTGCDGQFPYKLPHKDVAKVKMPLYPLSDFLSLGSGDNIMMMKVDTEGNELRVLRGAAHFFYYHKIRNAIVEVTPCCKFWKNAGVQKSDVVSIFGEIVSYGYVMVSLWDYKIFRTREETVAYLQNAPFRQSDMWLTLESDIVEMPDSVVPSKPTSGLNASSWYA